MRESFKNKAALKKVIKMYQPRCEIIYNKVDCILESLLKGFESWSKKIHANTDKQKVANKICLEFLKHLITDKIFFSSD